MTGRTKEPTETKGGSPTGDKRAEFFNLIIDLLKKEGNEAKIKELKELRLDKVYIGAFDASKERYYILKKPIGRELADAHLDILLDMQGAEPITETDEQGNKVQHTSPAAQAARKKAMKAWFNNILPQMLIYPEMDDINFAEQFYMFNVVFSEMESGVSTFQLLR